MIPAYMKEDESFYKVYKYIESIFEQINQTCEDIKNNFKFSVNSVTFLKALSLFGQNDRFKSNGTIYKGLHYNKAQSSWLVIPTDEPEEIDITLSELNLYYASKFNSIKNNFDGTFKSLKDSLTNVFNKDEDYISIIRFEQKVEEPYSIIEISVHIDQKADALFPPAGWYEEGHLWDIDYIKAEYKNTTEYNTYKNYLDFLTLYTNGYFSINILGVVVKYLLEDKSPIFIWNESNWNEATWVAKEGQQGGE